MTETLFQTGGTTVAMAQPPTAKPGVYSMTLENIGKSRPRVPVDTWTDNDAAAFWVSGYDPADPNAVPGSLVTALVARIFFDTYYRVPPMRRFFRYLKELCKDDWGLVYPLHNVRGVWAQVGMSWQVVCAAMHRANRPKVANGYEVLNTGLDAVAETSLGYCSRKSCKHRDSYLYGCLNERSFERLKGMGYLVPWSSVEWGGFATAFTPIRNCTKAPVLSVRRERSHVRANYVPYWVADQLNNLHRIVPQALLSDSFRTNVNKLLSSRIDALFTERFRFSSMHSIAANYDAVMQTWDSVFTQAAWDLHGPTDNPYELHDSIFRDLGIEYEVIEKLAASSCSLDSMFGTDSRPTDE